MKIEQFVKSIKTASLATYKSTLELSQCVLIGPDSITSPGILDKQIKIDWQFPGKFEPVAVNAKDLLTRLKIVPKGSTVDISAINNRFCVSWGMGKFEIPCLSDEYFPEWVDTGIPAKSIAGHADFKIDSFWLLSKIAQCRDAMAIKDIRYYLNGMLLDLSSKCHCLVSTDGHRLHKVRVTSDNDYTGPDLSIIIPDEVIHVLAKSLPKSGTVKIAIDYSTYEADFDTAKGTKIQKQDNQKTVVISFDNTTIKFRSIDGIFPDYNRVIPDNNRPLRISVNPKQVIQSLKNCAVFSSQKFKGVKLSGIHLGYSDNLILEVNLSDGSEYKEIVTVDSDRTIFDPDFHIGFNIPYLVDALSACTSENDVMMYFGSSADSLLIEDGEYKAVVMPYEL